MGGSPLVSLLARFPIAARIAAAGLKMVFRITSGRIQRSESFSLYFLAMLLGSISAKKNTKRDVTNVLIVTAPIPHMLVTCTVTIDAAPRWAMFVHIRIVLIVRSK